MRVLDRTDRVCESPSDVPCRAERELLIGPVLTELEKLARQESPARREHTPTIPTKKETPMSDYNPGGVVEGPYEEPAVPAATLEATLADFPPVLRPYLAHFEMKFAGPPLSQVLSLEAYRLADKLLDLPAAQQSPVLARLLFRLALRGR